MAANVAVYMWQPILVVFGCRPAHSICRPQWLLFKWGSWGRRQAMSLSTADRRLATVLIPICKTKLTRTREITNISFRGN